VIVHVQYMDVNKPNHQTIPRPPFYTDLFILILILWANKKSKRASKKEEDEQLPSDVLFSWKTCEVRLGEVPLVRADKGWFVGEKSPRPIRGRQRGWSNQRTVAFVFRLSSFVFRLSSFVLRPSSFV